jgi:hypothetical protein
MAGSPRDELHATLDEVARRYRDSFKRKEFGWVETDIDPLMRMFGVSQELKEANRQYWGRELGMCWQRLIVAVVAATCEDFEPALKVGDDEPCDLIVRGLAIDTKYRSGNGDSGTLKKFKQYGPLLKERGYSPTMLFLRSDNLPAAITAIKSGGWDVRMGEDSFAMIKELTGFDLLAWMSEKAGAYDVTRGTEHV